MKLVAFGSIGRGAKVKSELVVLPSGSIRLRRAGCARRWPTKARTFRLARRRLIWPEIDGPWSWGARISQFQFKLSARPGRVRLQVGAIFQLKIDCESLVGLAETRPLRP